MATEKVEVIPGWYLAVTAISQMTSSGHVLRVIPGVLNGRVVAQEVHIKQPTGRAHATFEALGALDLFAGAITTDVTRAITLEWFYDLIQEEVVNGAGVSFGDWVHQRDPERMRENGPTAETLELVATIYKVQYAVNGSPTKAIETWFKIPRSTAGRWVAMARKKGLLGEAPRQGKAGA